MTSEEEMVAWKVMDLWGAADARFSRKEIALIVGISYEKVDYYIELVKRARPEVYDKYSAQREKFHKQQIFEDNVTGLSSDVMDKEFSKERMDYDTPPSSKEQDYFIKRKIRRNGNDFGHAGEYED